ncbi:MAG: serine hydrolase, partial [Pirellulaceae bacterium]
SGESEYALADLPLEDQVPIEGVPTGPRAYHWRPDEPATLVWTEALDGGDPRRSVPHRDRIRLLREPFREEPTEVARTEHRFTSLVWSAQDGRALLREYDRERRWARTFWISADRPGETGVLLWDRSVQDRYSDPGTPLLRTLANGHRVLWQHGSAIFLEGEGASDEGDRPFLDRFDLETRQTERLFHCDRESYEQVIGLLRDDGREFITRWENPQEPPNYRIRQAGETAARSLTDFPDPTPQLRGIQKKLITYARADGVPLSFTLYLPPNHPPSHPLPTLVWAYPREYNEARTAGQVSGSTRRYTTIGGISHLFFVLAGYAVLDGASMPVVGTPETMNDTYVTQIVDSARAAIDKAVELGVTDPERVGVGGHSYGAFMTANLLAHSDLFRAGIARSGAYNRTLTPFGFQSERRTLWEARETYFRVSPFLAADRIREPLLLIHGAADDNTGTFPLQSERMYQAIHGNGGMARLVMLPYEAHAYVARESIEHTLAEMIDWFDRHVKPARQASVAPESVGAPVADFAALERMIQDELRASRTPGAAVAVIQDDKLVFAKGFGMASVDTREPVRPEMLFRLGSTTKMFTAATMGLLAAEGKLKFDEPVGNHIAQLHPAIAALTPHQLLTHTAGLTDESKMSGRHDDAVLGEIVRQMDDRHWLFARPGDVYSYANPGYWIAGHVCEVIERKPYADVLDERLFRALGMTRSTVRPTAAMSWPLAIGHEVRRGKAEVVRPQADNAATRPAGQIYSNVFELTRFVRALMAQGRLDGQQVLPADVVAQLSSPHVPRPGTSDQYGYGLAIGRWQGETIWQHGGSRAGYGSHIAMLPERRTAVIVLTNRTGSSLPRSWKIALSLTGVSGSAPSDESSEPAPWNEGEQQQFVGTFSNLRQTLEWYQEEGQLRWRRTKQTEDGPRAGRVVKLGPDLMGMLVADDESQSPVRVPVVRDEAGRVAYICISGRALRRQSEESEASR